MKYPVTVFVLHIFFLFVLSASGAKAANSETSKLASAAFKAAHDENFMRAKDLFGRLATIKEQELLNVDTPVAMKKQLNVALYRVLESVSDDAWNQKISVTGAKNITIAIQISKHYPRATIWLLRLTKLLKDMKNYSNANFVLGRLYFDRCFSKKEDCEEGLQEHQAALRNDPKFVYSYFSIGRMYLWKKQLAKARDAYMKALSLPSSNGMKAIAHASLMAIYGQQKQWSIANKHLEMAKSLGMPIPASITYDIKRNTTNKKHNLAKKSIGTKSTVSKESTHTDDYPLTKLFTISIVHGNFKVTADGFNLLVKEEENKLKKGDPFTAPGHTANIGFYRVLAKVAEDVLNKKISEKVGKELLASGMANSAGQIMDAIIINKNTLKRIKNYPGANFLLGRSYFRDCVSTGTYCKESIQQHRIALAYDPNFIHSYLELGIIYLHKKQFDEAIAIYEKAISIPTTNEMKGVAHTALASIYSEINRVQKSKRHMEKAISLGVIFPKKHPTTLKQNLAGNKKKTDVKIKAINAGHDGNFKVAQNLLNILAEEEEKKFKTEHTLKGFSNNADISYFRALEQVSNDAIENKITAKAAKLLFEATKLGGIQLNDGINLITNTIISESLESYPSARFLLGRLYFIDCNQKKRSCAKSIKEHQIALKHDPKLVYSYLDMGSIYKRMKKTEEAIKVYEKASLAPSRNRLKGIIHFELTKLYGQLLNGAKAKEHLQKSAALGIVIPEGVTKLVDMTVELTKQKSKSNTIEGWTLVTGGKESDTSFYFNSDALRKAKNKVLMPVLVDYKSAKKLGSTGKYYMSMKSEFEHDCGKKQYRVVSITTYSEREGKGEVLQKRASSRKWSQIKVGKVAERLWNHACKQHQKVANL